MTSVKASLRDLSSKDRRGGKPPVTVMAIESSGQAYNYPSLSSCCEAYHIRYRARLLELIHTGGLAPDGRTTFDLPGDSPYDTAIAKWKNPRTGRIKKQVVLIEQCRRVLDEDPDTVDNIEDE